MVYGAQFAHIQDVQLIQDSRSRTSQASFAPPTGEEILIPTAETKHLLSIKDFFAIIKNPNYFQTAFFLAVGEEISSNKFSIKLDGDQLHIRTVNALLSNFQGGLEEIRQILADALFIEKAGSVTIHPIQISREIHFKRDVSGTIDLKNWLSDCESKISDTDYSEYVQPFLPLFSEFLGLTFTKFNTVVTFDANGYDRTEKVKSLRFKWDPTTNYIYPIAAIKIVDRSASEMLQGFHKMYQEQMLCDYTIKAQDGEIALHSIVLYQLGGEYFQNLLNSGMKESSEKQVQLDYSLDVLKIFTDFLYLGKEVLEPKMFFKTHDGSHVFELLRLAHYCQNETLVNCCTNLISLSIGQENKQVIKELAELYQNAHLQRLYEYYSLPADLAAIKA